MAGHSKWSNIKHKKGKEDARRGKIFTKMARMITVAVKEGGSDPEYNIALQNAIDSARAENMPNDNIERAIKRASGVGVEENFEEIVYEGYGPEGVALLVECLTDNKNRTASDIRHAFDKFGGKMGQSGSVTFQFERKGILITEDEYDEEELMLEVLEAGADDLFAGEDYFEIQTSVEDFGDVKKTLQESGMKFEKLSLAFLPANFVSIESKENQELMEKLIDTLEENDDVQEVFHNWEMED